MLSDENYMHRCIELASQALGYTAPNPMVGALIVHEGKIISEGFHRIFGGPHAEADAIEKVKNKSLLKRSTLYVNLEPCSHKGKTPPCAELIIKSGIPRVVVGNPDPNTLVAGKGIGMLENSGVNVIKGVCENECIELNKRFFTFHILKRPYIILKWAQTTDGFIDVIRTHNNTGINWISNELSRILVHKWRSEEQSIMAGTNTVRLDNPMLNTRQWSGKNPLRIIPDQYLSLDKKLHVFDHSLPTIILNEKKSEKINRLEYLRVSFDNGFLHELMKTLYEKGIQSLIVEGGKKLIEQFVALNLWDESRVFIGEKSFGKGLEAPVLNNSPTFKTFFRNDQLVIYRNYNPYFSQIKKILDAIAIS